MAAVKSRFQQQQGRSFKANSTLLVESSHDEALLYQLGEDSKETAA